MSAREWSARTRLVLLVVALVCLAGALALSFLAPRYGVSDWISFSVMSGYVVAMLLFLLSLPEPPADTSTAADDGEKGSVE